MFNFRYFNISAFSVLQVVNWSTFKCFNCSFVDIIPVMCSLSPSPLAIVATSFNLSTVQLFDLSTFQHLQIFEMSDVQHVQLFKLQLFNICIIRLFMLCRLLKCWFIVYRESWKVERLKKLKMLKMLKSWKVEPFTIKVNSIFNVPTFNFTTLSVFQLFKVEDAEFSLHSYKGL